MIDLDHIRVSRNGKTILDDIVLSIKQGEKIWLRGESGSGKSTLLKAILFFERFSGNVVFDGHPVEAETVADFRRRIAYIGQTAPPIHENARLFMHRPLSYRANRATCFDPSLLRSTADTLGFAEKDFDKNFHELSGGEKQRMLILQILLLNRPVFILDEVTAALDKKNIRRVIRLLTGDPGRTVISVSHNHEWQRCCTRVIELASGSIVTDRRTGNAHGR